MKNTLLKCLTVALAYLSVLYPVWVATQNVGSISMIELFPVFGIIAFTLLWLHSMSGVFEPWLRKNFNFDKFVSVTSITILVAIILHPLLLLLNYNFDFNKINLIWEADDVRIGVIGWLLLITYDITKPLKKYDFFSRNWNNILTISTLGFILIFFHSLELGGELQSGPLRIVWIFYGLTAIFATTYTYGIRRFWK